MKGLRKMIILKSGLEILIYIKLFFPDSTPLVTTSVYLIHLTSKCEKFITISGRTLSVVHLPSSS
jgi:hypothetical protein